MSLYGAIELGGTKTICAIVDNDLNITDRIRFATADPKTTLAEACDFFIDKGILSLGIGSFGPLDIKGGKIGNTPKPGWKDTDLFGHLSSLGVPMYLDTDVGCACLAESYHLGDKGVVGYITVGTGIGAGIVSEGRILHGSMHPEMGHIDIVRLPDDDMEGVCMHHPDCCESVASGPALWRRCGKDPSTISEDDPVWDIEARYLAQLVYTMILTISPDSILLGGGVMDNTFLLDKIREYVHESDHGFVNYDTKRIVLAGMKGDQGIIGCALLAIRQSSHGN